MSHLALSISSSNPVQGPCPTPNSHSPKGRHRILVRPRAAAPTELETTTRSHYLCHRANSTKLIQARPDHSTQRTGSANVPRLKSAVVRLIAAPPRLVGLSSHSCHPLSSQTGSPPAPAGSCIASRTRRPAAAARRPRRNRHPSRSQSPPTTPAHYHRRTH